MYPLGESGHHTRIVSFTYDLQNSVANFPIKNIRFFLKDTLGNFNL